MNIADIKSELDLRHWLAEYKKFKIDWVEPGLYGSSMGAPDCKVHYYDWIISLELKIFVQNKYGIKCSVRPSQRRWHYQHMRTGGRSAILAFVFGSHKTSSDCDKLILIRGDNIPWRDYASHPESHCKDGRLNYRLVGNMFDDNVKAHNELEKCLFQHYFWEE
jgi:hypothetical protein